MTKIEEINVKMLEEFKVQDIEDTSENRYYFLQGLQEAWNEDPETSTEKSLYQIALSIELTLLKVKIALKK